MCWRRETPGLSTQLSGVPNVREGPGTLPSQGSTDSRQRDTDCGHGGAGSPATPRPRGQLFHHHRTTCLGSDAWVFMQCLSSQARPDHTTMEKDQEGPQTDLGPHSPQGDRSWRGRERTLRRKPLTRSHHPTPTPPHSQKAPTLLWGSAAATGASALLPQAPCLAGCPWWGRLETPHLKTLLLA